ncbi:MAG: hypothetical protein ACJ75Z_14535 [Solirubrobacterales bacterium]
MSWKVTVRRGSSVGREKFGSLDEAVEHARRQVEEIGREDRLPTINFMREFTPEKRVNARIEISGPGLIRTPEGGIDVMGDGTAIVYVGAIRKQAIEADSLDEALERLHGELSD